MAAAGAALAERLLLREASCRLILPGHVRGWLQQQAVWLLQLSVAWLVGRSDLGGVIFRCMQGDQTQSIAW